MFGWKVDIGIVDRSLIGTLSSMSEITILDKDVSLIFATSNFNYSNTLVGAPSDVYDIATIGLGNDVNYLYSLPASVGNESGERYQNSLNTVTQTFPSVPLAYTLSWDRCLSSLVSQPIYEFAIVFRQFEKVFIGRYGQPSYVYDISGTALSLYNSYLSIQVGLISSLPAFTYNNRPYSSLYHVAFNASQEISRETLIDNDNWRRFNFGSNVSDNTQGLIDLYVPGSFNARCNIGSILNDIFGSNYKDPDWDNTDIDDPYDPGGESGPGGGTGDFDDTSDPIDFPSLPTLSAVDTSFISLFNPSLAELRNLASYMWSDSFDITNWKKIFADPMDAIIGLSIVPVNVPNGGVFPVTVGNMSTGITMNRAASQYVVVDCGTLNVNEYWGAYLDYDPYTKADIYLPYIGTHALSVDDIMGKSVHVVYHVDILSGACCAYVKCGESVLYSFVGQCSCAIPISGDGNDFLTGINSALSIASSIGTMVATGGASAPMSISSIANAAVNALKPNVEKSGAMGGMGGILGIQTPYLILTRPRQALPARQHTFTGYPTFITVRLGECSGYTEVDRIHLENIPATQAELSEIESLLKSGVIL